MPTTIWYGGQTPGTLIATRRPTLPSHAGLPVEHRAHGGKEEIATSVDELGVTADRIAVAAIEPDTRSRAARSGTPLITQRSRALKLKFMRPIARLPKQMAGGLFAWWAVAGFTAEHARRGTQLYAHYQTIPKFVARIAEGRSIVCATRHNSRLNVVRQTSVRLNDDYGATRLVVGHPDLIINRE